MAQLIHCGGAARDPCTHNFFQITDVDSGVIRWVNADLVTQACRGSQANKKAPHLAGTTCLD
tara:strand:- start:273 stop:458 length:186 start_codon:yes stop_codon:yes gene_type:complete